MRVSVGWSETIVRQAGRYIILLELRYGHCDGSRGEGMDGGVSRWYGWLNALYT